MWNAWIRSCRNFGRKALRYSGRYVVNWSYCVHLLGGYPPFIESNQRTLFRKIRKGQYEFHEEYWGQVSEDAKDLIRNLLVVDPDKRYTSEQALENKWIGADAS